MTESRPKGVYQFGAFYLDPAERLLLRAGQPVPLTPKAFDLLVYLVERQGRLVEKSTLMAALWPDTIVEEANLAFQISALRKVLDDSDAASLIQTVPTRGYRFAASVTISRSAADGNLEDAADKPDVSATLVNVPQEAARERIIEIEDAPGGPIEHVPAVPKGGGAGRWRWAVVAGVALLGGAIIASLGVWTLKPSPLSASRPVARVVVTLPADEELVTTFPLIAVSPDGAHLAYVAKRRGIQQLHLRALDSLESRALLGTEGATAPFFSPDSQWVGFFADAKLKKIRVSGGASQVLCDARDAYGGSWAPNDVIYFAPGSFSGLWQVSATGGAPQPFTKLQKAEISHRSPQVLPGGRAVLFTSRTGPGSDERSVQVQLVPSGERHVVAQGDTGNYVPTGHLVYVQAATGTLVAVPFDLTSLQVGTAAPVAVAEGILVRGEGTQYASSANGLLAYVAGRSDVDDRALVWVDRHGKSEPLIAPGRPYELPRVSPDGDQLAFMTSGAKMDVWIHNFARGNATKLISEESNQFPIWTPDGKRVTYRATRAGTRNIFWRMADGSGTEERLTTGKGNHAPTSWSPDGQVLLYLDATEGEDIIALRFTEHKMQPFLATRSYEGAAQFSPDGHWVAYVSDESSREEIYVKPYSGAGGTWQISTDGGTEPIWNPNGRELFYRSGNKMMAVDVATRPDFTAGRPAPLFTGDFVRSSSWFPNYDVSRDGRRFLMIQPSANETATPTQIIVVLNWFEELKRLAPHPLR